MKMHLLTLILPFCFILLAQCQYYQCISSSFESSCKTKLYACTNNAECSYQLHENTKHIFLYEESTEFPTLYFSNPLARDLYECMKNACQLPPIDEKYPKTLPFDSCLIEVYDTCKGDIQAIYQNPKSSSVEAQCYRKYCNFPTLQNIGYWLIRPLLVKSANSFQYKCCDQLFF